MSLEIDKIFKKVPSNNWQDDISILWQLSNPYIRRLIAAVICGLILSGINGAIAWATKPVLDSIFVEKAAGFLILLPFGIIILFFLRGVFTYLTNYLMSCIGAKIVRSLRQGIYDKLLTLPISFYNRTSSGSVVSKVLNKDHQAIQSI